MDLKNQIQRLNSEHQHDVGRQLRGVSARADQARNRGASGWVQRSRAQVEAMDVGMDAGIVSLALREHGIR